jgi:hypothetical protein
MTRGETPPLASVSAAGQFDRPTIASNEDAHEERKSVVQVARHAPGARLALQNLKMARSAHACVRGNALKFYAW